MQVALKDLVWKEKNVVKELEEKWARKADSNRDFGCYRFYFNNAEQIAKEKAEILNKKYEYTKDDIIEMFVEAGFKKSETNGGQGEIKFQVANIYIKICFYLDSITMYLSETWNENNTFKRIIIERPEIRLNDCKSIEFYYNKFREMLEFEVGE